jgi:hypothetical protein
LVSGITKPLTKRDLEIYIKENTVMKTSYPPTKRIFVTALYTGMVPKNADMDDIRQEIDKHFSVTDFEIELNKLAEMVNFKFENVLVVSQ